MIWDSLLDPLNGGICTSLLHLTPQFFSRRNKIRQRKDYFFFCTGHCLVLRLYVFLVQERHQGLIISIFFLFSFFLFSWPFWRPPWQPAPGAARPLRPGLGTPLSRGCLQDCNCSNRALSRPSQYISMFLTTIVPRFIEVQC